MIPFAHPLLDLPGVDLSSVHSPIVLEEEEEASASAVCMHCSAVRCICFVGIVRIVEVFGHDPFETQLKQLFVA